MSFESVKAIIDGHAYGSLIGLQEDAWLEAKGGTPYNLDSPEGRYELAKDVAAFANGTGGIVIVGLRTTRHATTQTDEITDYDLCRQATFNATQYAALIAEYIHPTVEGLAVYWVSVNPEGTHGLGIIEVPPQNPDRQYFLIANAIDSGSRVRQFVFGIVRRNESSNDPFTIAQLYQYTQKGKSTLAQTLTRIEDKLDAVLIQGRHIDTHDPEETYAARAARILDDEEGS
jgi:predicted HTH transcriptional regulator